jgi:hypothetical protein
MTYIRNALAAAGTPMTVQARTTADDIKQRFTIECRLHTQAINILREGIKLIIHKTCGEDIKSGVLTYNFRQYNFMQPSLVKYEPNSDNTNGTYKVLFRNRKTLRKGRRAQNPRKKGKASRRVGGRSNQRRRGNRNK